MRLLIHIKFCLKIADTERKLNPLERLLIKKTKHPADEQCFNLLQEKLLNKKLRCKLEDIDPRFLNRIPKQYLPDPSISSTGQSLFYSSEEPQSKENETQKQKSDPKKMFSTILKFIAPITCIQFFSRSLKN